MAALLAHIRELIAKNGPLSVASYMELALQHPDYGYYRHHDPLGTEGDFVTAPEISQMFGEMIGLWCADAWQQMGGPKAFTLLEMGPGARHPYAGRAARDCPYRRISRCAAALLD